MTSTALIEFRARVETFLDETGMAISRFGRLAVNDGSFVTNLRGGTRQPSFNTIDRVDNFMRIHLEKHASVAPAIIISNNGEVEAA